MDHQVLLGRNAELLRIKLLASDVARGTGFALLVHGEAGVGKSTLIAHALESADDDAVVLSATGLLSEAQLPFSGLHQLLQPVLADRERLPTPQRAALEAAFGLIEAPAIDRFLIGIGTVALLSERATAGPVLMVVEDAQWLDAPSAETLAFVARRLSDDAIGLILSLRDGWPSPLLTSGLPALEVLPLGAEDSALLLDRRAPGLTAAQRTRILRVAAGNPLALIELPIIGTAPASPAPSAAMPINARLERAFTDRINRLGESSRSALLIAASSDADDIGEIAAAIQTMGPQVKAMEDLGAALAAGLISITDGRLTFRHPLIRTATYQAASPAARADAHAALALAVAGDPDRAIWHRAAAAPGPDTDIADALARAAGSARRRGAPTVAVAALERSIQLTPDPQVRFRRLLEAAEMGLEIGRPDLLERIGHEANAPFLSATDRARLAIIEEFRGGTADSEARVLTLIARAEDVRKAGATDLALEMLRYAALRAWWSVADESIGARVAAATVPFDLPAAEPRRLAIVAIADPDGHAAEVARNLQAGIATAADDALQLRLVGHAALTTGDMRSAASILASATDLLRPQGRMALLVPALALLAWAALWSGDWRRARSAADEAVRHASETGDDRWTSVASIAVATIAALRGERDEAEQSLAGIAAIALAVDEPTINSAIERARGMMALAEGLPSDALDHLLRVFDPTGPAFHRTERRLVIGFLAEAAVLAGREDEVRTIIDELEIEAAGTPSPSFHYSMRYARALLATDDDADALYQAALEADRGGGPFVRARTELAYGTWLRRQRRAARSRDHLRAARDSFDAIGASPWAERARQELRAAGEASRRREPNVIDALTAQEWQIARMAADGLSNREIGERLYLSHRTVGSHLYRIFPKLGITSRGHLVQALDAIAPDPAPPPA